jgi:hypothetical protein
MIRIIGIDHRGLGCSIWAGAINGITKEGLLSFGPAHILQFGQHPQSADVLENGLVIADPSQSLKRSVLIQVPVEDVDLAGIEV